MKQINIATIMVVIVASIFMGATGCLSGSISMTQITTTPPAPPITMSLSFSEPPDLNKPVGLTLTTNVGFMSMENLTIRIILPDGFEHVSGDISWSGVPENNEIKIDAVVEATRVGYFRISAQVLWENVEFEWVGGTSKVYVEVTSTDAIIGNRPTNTWYHSGVGVQIFLPVEDNRVNATLETSATPELNKETTIKYTVSPLIDLPENTNMSILLPHKGHEIVNTTFPFGGQESSGWGINWKGQILENQTAEMSLTLKFTSEGWGEIYAGVYTPATMTTYTNYLNTLTLYTYVDKYGGFATLNRDEYNSWLDNRGASDGQFEGYTTTETWGLILLVLVPIVLVFAIIIFRNFRRRD